MIKSNMTDMNLKTMHQVTFSDQVFLHKGKTTKGRGITMALDRDLSEGRSWGDLAFTVPLALA